VKLYDSPGAPNPRRVRIFLSEKGLDVPSAPIDLRKREHKSEAFLKKNPSGKIPVLELDDGTTIAESVAICRYLESLTPEPNLFGRTPLEIAQIEATHRQIELELSSQVGVSWVNGPVVAKLFGPAFVQIPAAKERADQLVSAYYERLDRELAAREYIAGARFTVVDITAFCMIDFAIALVGLRPSEGLKNLWRWHASVASRPSTKANPGAAGIP
jgi:glutathione S-transferase